jgi:chromosome segregation protein
VSRLRELRLHGFKTFADPTRFVFEPGVNAVIGPNGSGKSNMADAVRWVLGEQSNRSLRTRKSDDVIFAGSQQRKALGMAEAVLTLDNSDGWLPIDFAEVSIGRRAYRSGESEYLINGARARLRDVVELLGEGRLGANELVVVGQGTVDAALSLRPEERRQLFEEAAGIKNLQVRKNEALSRLARARDNLTRVNDLVAELKPQVRRLAQQAQHQQEHDTLLRRARGLVDASYRRRERTLRDSAGEARRSAAAAEAALEALRGEQQAGRELVEEAERRYWAAEEAARQASGERETTREALIRAESRAEALAARRSELSAALGRGEQELGELRAAMERARPSVDSALDDLLRSAADAEREWQSSIQALADADAALVAAEDALADARRRHAQRLAADARRREAALAGDARRARLEPELGAARHRLGGLRAELAAATEQRDEARRALGTAETASQEADAALRSADAEARDARRAADALQARLEAARGELAALEEHGDAPGRLGSQLAAAGWQPLLDALDAPEDAWAAVEAVVGGELGEVLLWRDGDPAPAVAESRGVARLLRESGREPAERAQALRAVGGDRTVAEWVGSGAPEILARTVVAPSLDALRAGWPELPAGWLAVTAEGDVADGRGVLSLRGRRDAGTGRAARRHARRRELGEMAARLEAEHQTATVRAEAAAATLAAAEQEHRARREARTEAERRERDAATALEALASRCVRAEREASELEAQLAATEHAESPAETEAASLPAELEALAERAAATRSARDAAAQRRDAARGAWSQARDAAQHAEAASAGERQERARLDARAAQLAIDLPASRQALAVLADEHRAAVAVLDAARAADEQVVRSRAEADAHRERLRSELLEHERSAGGAGSRLAELERTAQVAAIDASRHEEAVAALARERELAFESLAVAEAESEASAKPGDEAPADLAAQTEELSAEIAALDDEALETELRRVRRTLGKIGSVNPFAVEEHRELATRLEELTGQDADLGAAIVSTDELIAQLEQEIGERFNAAFAAIGERFDEFCRLLFAGGNASLQMSDGADGDAPGGIEIVVQPPGKRRQRLAMLSGGERALTGVALLFAMLSVNPVPFCILDEVDAALDEANIGRFAEALRKLSETTDFVVITHNRATIEVADTIYGVTMTDAAVSRILSLRLADVPVEVSA